jgi:hypothetical protein
MKLLNDDQVIEVFQRLRSIAKTSKYLGIARNTLKKKLKSLKVSSIIPPGGDKDIYSCMRNVTPDERDEYYNLDSIGNYTRRKFRG